MQILRKLKWLISIILKIHFPGASTRQFIQHNKKIWDNKPDVQDDGEILFEYNGMCSAVISYSYLASVLAKKHQANIVAYQLKPSKGFFGAIVDYHLRYFERVFSSFNVNKIIIVKPTSQQKLIAEKIAFDLLPTLKTKRDIENIKVNNIWIGDLIYDTYLKQDFVPTIDINDEKFLDSLKQTLAIFVYWKDYLEDHNVKAVNASHLVYDLAILLRIAIAQKIPAYQINATHVYYLDDKNLFSYTDFYYYPEQIKRINQADRDAGIKDAKARIKRRFTGEVGVDMHYSTMSAYSTSKNYRLIRESDKKKVFIALHDFFDSPHSYGINLFPDFYDWLEFLGCIANKTDYDWYLKTHPDVYPGNEKTIEYFISKYPKFTLLPSNTSHHQIIREGIDVALTTYGTIGFEYAALGIPVINASLCNPHIAYDFNLHPATVDEYERILLNLDTMTFEIDVQKVYEYYYMKFIYNNNNWLFNDYSDMIKNLGGYKKQFSPQVYDYLLNEYTQSWHQEKLNKLEKFIQSEKFRMQD